MRSRTSSQAKLAPAAPGAFSVGGLARDPEKWEPAYAGHSRLRPATAGDGRFSEKITRKSKTWSGKAIQAKLIPR
jgi:hypothetical protein